MRAPTFDRATLAPLLALTLLAGGAAAAAQAPAADPPAAPAAGAGDAPPATAPELPNQRDPLPGVRTGGMPAGPEGWRALAEAGFRTFVDLRSDAEVGPETRAAAEGAGLAYERIAIAGDADLDLASARALHALLDEPARGPLVLACASGNRVGALVAAERFWLHGEPADAALALGKAAGLTRLEPAVRQILGLPPLPPPAPAAPPAPAPPQR
jgi:protein tyrosine phosphatase (PTP) superfamily phosphohydrolase (DUF442 family)